MFDMSELMKKAQELSTNMQEQQEQLAKETIEVSVGGEMVKMTFNGKLEAQSLQIDPEVIDPNDPETSKTSCSLLSMKAFAKGSSECKPR